MKKVAKIILLLSIISVSLSMIWFLFGSTACFQKNVDLVETVIFILVGFPALLFVALAVMALKKGWLPVSASGKSGLIITIIILIVIAILSVAFIAAFIQNTTVYGWIKESVIKDYIQTTTDGKYEYRLELINMFQRNSYARIYIKDIENGEETTIQLNIPTKEKLIVLGGEGYTTSETDEYLWSELVPSEIDDIYILTTTEFFDRENSYCFQIDMKNMTAKLVDD